MKQKSVGLTLRAFIVALALILVAGSPALPPFDGVAYAQDAPQNLLATPAPSNASVTLTWDAVSGADSYEVWRGDGSGSTVSWPSSALATGETGTTYTDNTVTAGNTYSYAVRAVQNGTGGTFSNVDSVALGGGTPAPAGVPSVTVVAASITSVTVSWTPLSDATDYQIQFWHADLNDWELISGNQTSPYTHTGLTAGTQYYYVVRGVNSGVEGDWSSWRTDDSQVTLQATTSVPVVTLTRVDRTTVTISWTSTGSAQYDLERRKITAGGTSPGTTAWSRLPSDLLTDITYTDQGANYIPTDADSVKYEYRVQAVDTQAWSSVKSISVPKLGAVVGTPGNVRVASLSDSSIRISWDAVTGADFYQIQRKTADSGYTSPVRIDALSYEDTGLSPSTQYTYQVRAVDVNGAGDWSSERSRSTRSVGSSGLQMPKVTGLVVTDATSPQTDVERSAKLTWNAVSDATHYDIQRYDPTTATAWEVLGTGGDFVTVAGATRIEKPSSSPPTYTDTFETGAHGKTYFYVVSAVKQADADGASVAATDEMGDWSDYKSFTFKFLPPPDPDSLTAQMTSGTSIWVSWTAGTPSAADDPPTDAGTSYMLEWRTDDTSSWNRIPIPSGTTYHHTGLSSSSAYRYRVRAENTGGSSDSEPAGTDGFRVELGNRLSPPSGVTAVDATTGEIGSEVPGIKVSWNAVTGATGYEVQRYDTGGDAWGSLDGTTANGVETVTGQATTSATHTGTGVAAEATNIYRVRTVQSETKSDWSAPVSGTARAAIVAATTPTLVAASTGVSMIRLSWTAVDGATNYEWRFVEGSQTADNIELIDPTAMTVSGSHRNEVHRNLKAGQLYSYQVRALIGADAMTNWSTVAQQITKPSAPDLSTTNVTANSITLTWSATSFNGDRLTAAENYHIQRRTTGGDWESVITPAGNVANNAVTCTNNVCTLLDDAVDTDIDTDSADDGLSKGTTYYYRIRATSTATPAGGAATTYTSYWDYTNQTTPSQ